MRAVRRPLSYTLAFALQLKENHGKTSVRVAEECQLDTTGGIVDVIIIEYRA
jgi:hypothetical protein